MNEGQDGVGGQERTVFDSFQSTGSGEGMMAPISTEPQVSTEATPVTPPSPAQTGDIILGSGVERKNRRMRRILLLAGAGAVVVAGIIVLVLWLTGIIGGVPVGMRGAFRDYVTYVLEGPNESDEVGAYYIDVMYDSDEFLDEAEKRFNKAYDEFKKKNISSLSEAGLSQTGGYYEFLRKRDDVPAVNEDALLAEYIKGGEAAAEKYTLAYYEKNRSENYLLDTLALYYKERADARVDYWGVYMKNGCIAGGVINMSCVGKLPYEATKDVSKKLGDADMEIGNLTDIVVGNIVTQCKSILEVVGGK